MKIYRVKNLRNGNKSIQKYVIYKSSVRTSFKDIEDLYCGMSFNREDGKVQKMKTFFDEQQAKKEFKSYKNKAKMVIDYKKWGFEKEVQVTEYWLEEEIVNKDNETLMNFTINFYSNVEGYKENIKKRNDRFKKKRYKKITPFNFKKDVKVFQIIYKLYICDEWVDENDSYFKIRKLLKIYSDLEKVTHHLEKLKAKGYQAFYETEII